MNAVPRPCGVWSIPSRDGHATDLFPRRRESAPVRLRPADRGGRSPHRSSSDASACWDRRRRRPVNGGNGARPRLLSP